MAEQFKIKRSDGTEQFVTQEELEELNSARKKRDQMKSYSTFRNPFSAAIKILLIFVALMAMGLTLEIFF